MPKQKNVKRKEVRPYLVKDKANALYGADSSQEPELLVCDKCTATVDQLIQCERCQVWYCSQCENVPVKLMELLDEFKDEVHWFCHYCKTLALEAIRNFNSSSDTLPDTFRKTFEESISKVIENVAKEVNKLTTSFENHCRTLVEKSASLLPKDDTMDISNGVEDVGNRPSNVLVYSSAVQRTSGSVMSIIDEIKDRNRRRCNLIIHNLPEPEQSSAPEKAAADLKSVKNIVHDKLLISDSQVMKVTIIGKHKENAHRSLLVTLDSEKSKWRCLRQAPKLRNDTTFKRVYLAPDLTARERESNKRLYLELKSRKEKGEKDLIIKNGWIVKRNTIPRQPGMATDEAVERS